MPKKGLSVRLTRSNGFLLAEIVELETSISMALGLAKQPRRAPHFVVQSIVGYTYMGISSVKLTQKRG